MLDGIGDHTLNLTFAIGVEAQQGLHLRPQLRRYGVLLKVLRSLAGLEIDYIEKEPLKIIHSATFILNDTKLTLFSGNRGKNSPS